MIHSVWCCRAVQDAAKAERGADACIWHACAAHSLPALTLSLYESTAPQGDACVHHRRGRAVARSRPRQRARPVLTQNPIHVARDGVGARACRRARSAAAPSAYPPATSSRSPTAAAAAARAVSAMQRPKCSTAAAYSGPPGHSPRAPGGGAAPGSASSAAHLACRGGSDAFSLPPDAAAAVTANTVAKRSPPRSELTSQQPKQRLQALLTHRSCAHMQGAGGALDPYNIVLWRAGDADLPGARGDQLPELMPCIARRVCGWHLLRQPPHARGARLRQRKLRAPDLTSGLPRAREAPL